MWFLYLFFLLAASDEDAIRAKLRAGTGTIDLPAGVVEVTSEIEIPANAHDLVIRGASGGTVLRAMPTFHGRAIFTAASGKNIQFQHFEIEGSRAALAKPTGLPGSEIPFVRFTQNNGILAENIQHLVISDVAAREVAGFPVLIAKSDDVHIEKVSIHDSGSENAKKRNNTTGGILLEEGTSHFAVQHCDIQNVSGNGIWTHSLYHSPRNNNGVIADNTFAEIGRDAIQVGHATNIRVERNKGERIGYPERAVDAEGGGIPVAIDTAGNTSNSTYADNHFIEVNGKCMDLDGFHDGEIRGNICENHQPANIYKFGAFGIVMNNSNPDMQSRNITITGNTIDGTLYGGIFVIGSGHHITHNQLMNLNMAHCPDNAAQFGCYLSKEEPDILRTGIYLGRGAERPDLARDNVIEDNQIIGFQMGNHCLHVAPGVTLVSNRTARNNCSDDVTVNARNRVSQFPIRRVF